MVPLLIEYPLLLLFLVGAIGYAIGHLKIGGFQLGIAAVLFTGLFFGALDPNLKLPDFVYLLGLVIFVYTIGISSGPGFRRIFNRKGLRDNLFAVSMLVLAFGVTMALHFIFRVKGSLAAGLFSGSLTNTPALAAVLDSLKDSAKTIEIDKILAEPVMAYSVSYPMGVIGVILTMFLFHKAWRIDYDKENAHSHSTSDQEAGQLSNATLRVTKTEAVGLTPAQLVKRTELRVLFGRIKRRDDMHLVDEHTRLEMGDLLTVVGAAEEIERFIPFVGEPSQEHIDLERSILDYSRIIVSNAEAVEVPLHKLQLPQHHGGLITRVRRGDVEFLPDRNTVLEFGDNVRVVAPRPRLEGISRFLGNSVKAVSEIDIISFSLGIALGLLLGSIPFPLPGGGEFKFGVAGGPLIAGLILGMKGRTGPIIWQLPFSANLTLRQLGLFLFLAGIGTKSGYAFISTFLDSEGFTLFLAGTAITIITTCSILLVGHKALKIPMATLIGMAAAIHTQPAVLAYANEQAKNDQVNLGYASVYPLSTISKILLAQAILILCGP